MIQRFFSGFSSLLLYSNGSDLLLMLLYFVFVFCFLLLTAAIFKRVYMQADQNSNSHTNFRAPRCIELKSTSETSRR